MNLLAKNEKEYVDKAVYIAKNKEYLNQLKNKLIASKDSNPLFDNKSFTIILKRHTVSYLKNILIKKIQKIFIYN